MNNRRIASLMAALSGFAGSVGYDPFSKKKGYVAEYESTKSVKGDPGQYDKLKHMSKAQRKRYKEKLRRKNK